MQILNLSNMGKRFQCPTCGKFLNNDVHALREKLTCLEGIAEERDAATKRNRDLEGQVSNLQQEVRKYQAKLAAEKEVYNSFAMQKKEAEEKLVALQNRGLLARIFNKK